MKIGIPRETAPGERRVALTPESVEMFKKLGYDLMIESGAGAQASFSDDAYRATGVTVLPGAEELWKQSDIILKVTGPSSEEVGRMTTDKTLITFIAPAQNKQILDGIAKSGGTALSMDSVPRISRAQKCDALSSMANVAGYRAVVEAAQHYGRFFAGQITAAGKSHLRRC
jgi:H+-translocating NAD(P) transhydrogenase subunit alpha